MNLTIESAWIKFTTLTSETTLRSNYCVVILKNSLVVFFCINEETKSENKTIQFNTSICYDLAFYYFTFHMSRSTVQNTGGPRYIREIGTPKIGWHIMNSHIKRPTITVN
jgi:hypothetical protein